MKKFIKKLKSPLGLAVIALLLVAGTVAGSIKAAQKYGAVTFDVNNGGYVNLTLEGMADQFGAFITSGTNFTDVAISNDLTVDGATSFTGAATLGSTASVAGLLTTNAGQLRSYTNTTSTADTTQTLVEADILNYDVVLMTPTTGATTITFPATSTMSNLVPSAGDMFEQCWYNATSTAAMEITFAAGTGIDFQTASSSATDLSFGTGETACLKYIRQTDTDISVLMTEYVDAD